MGKWFSIYIYIYILYNVGGSWSVLTTNCTVIPLRTPFGLIIPLLQSSITRNYNHTIISYAVTHVHGLQSLIRSWLQSLITLLHYSHLLHVHIGWLLSYHSCLKLSHTSRVETSLVGLLLQTARCKNWMRRHFRSAYNSPVGPVARAVLRLVAERRTIDISPTVADVSQWRGCLLRCLGDACDVTAACPSPLAERSV
jgi:hypothetical protein